MTKEELIKKWKENGQLELARTVIEIMEYEEKRVKEEIIKKIEGIEKRWTKCERKDCDNKEECERANHYVETIWKPAFKDLEEVIKSITN